MVNCIFVGIGGFIGAVCRYLIGLIPLKADPVFPVRTFVINIVGAFAIGMIAALAVKNPSVNPHLILLLKVGICGGFTTFSTFAFETTDLIQNGNVWTALAYAVLSMVLGILAVVGAQMLVK